MQFQCEFIISYEVQHSEKVKLSNLRDFVESYIRCFSEKLDMEYICNSGVVQHDEYDEMHTVYWPQDTFILTRELKQNKSYHHLAMIFQGLYGIMGSLSFPYSIEYRLV